MEKPGGKLKPKRNCASRTYTRRTRKNKIKKIKYSKLYHKPVVKASPFPQSISNIDSLNEMKNLYKDLESEIVKINELRSINMQVRTPVVSTPLTQIRQTPPNELAEMGRFETIPS